MGNFTNKGLNYRPTWASIQNKPTTISGWLTDVYTKSEVDSIVDDAINDLVNAAPGALDTLNELAAALGDDANFASTVTNSLAGKVSLSGSYSKPSWLTQVAASIVEQSANYRFVTDTEKTTWNGKQDALTNPVTGTGTNNYLTKWSNGQIVDSSIIDTGSSISYFQPTVRQYAANPIFSIDASSGSPSLHLKAGSSILIGGIIGDYLNGNIKIGGYASGYFPAFYANNNEVGRFFPNGRFAINTTTDSGYQFDVNGTGRFTGALSTANMNMGGAMSLSNSAYFIGSPSYGIRFNNSSNTQNNVIINESTPTYFRLGINTDVALTVPNGGTGLTSLTTGYIPFGNGTSALNTSANLFWDNSNSRFSVGASSPTARFTIKSTDQTYLGGLHFTNSGNSNTWALVNDSNGDLNFGYATDPTLAANFMQRTIFNTNGRLNLQSSITADAIISLRSTLTTIGNHSMIRFGDVSQTTNYQKGAIIYESVSSSSRGKLHLALENTDGSGSVSLSDAKLTVFSNGNITVGTPTDSGYKFDVNGTARASKFYVTALNTAPSSASDTGTAGEIRFTSTAIYICTATNTWKKAEIATW